MRNQTLRARTVMAAVVAILVVSAATAVWLTRSWGRTVVTAYFNQAVGVYAGSEVRILGVAVGRVESVTPEAQHVRVVLSIDGEVPIPADVRAAVVAPSLVSDRYLQLTPPYTGGAKLTGGAVIPTERTVTPIELDQLYASLNELAVTLGPDGTNTDGALSELLDTIAANFDGNGAAFGNMIADLGDATRTLSGSADDLFATIGNLDKFTEMLAANDAEVRRAEQQLAEVAAFLAADRSDLAAALRELATALEQVSAFIEANRGRIASNVDSLAQLTQILVDQRQSLAETLDVLPLAATNLENAYDPGAGTFRGRADLNELTMGPSATFASPAALPLPAVGYVQTTSVRS